MENWNNIEISKLVNLAIDLWRLKEKVSNISYLNEQDREKLKVSLDRLNKFIQEINITVKWFNWDKYFDEINFYELKWIEETNDINNNNIIKETIEPAIFMNEQIIKKAKIIVYKFNS